MRVRAQLICAPRACESELGSYVRLDGPSSLPPLHEHIAHNFGSFTKQHISQHNMRLGLFHYIPQCVSPAFSKTSRLLDIDRCTSNADHRAFEVRHHDASARVGFDLGPVTHHVLSHMAICWPESSLAVLICCDLLDGTESQERSRVSAFGLNFIYNT